MNITRFRGTKKLDHSELTPNQSIDVQDLFEKSIEIRFYVVDRDRYIVIDKRHDFFNHLCDTLDEAIRLGKLRLEMTPEEIDDELEDVLQFREQWREQ